MALDGSPNRNKKPNADFHRFGEIDAGTLSCALGPLRTTNSPMSITVIILIGLVVGIIAKFLMPGRDPGGFIVTTLLGIAGAIVANFVGQKAVWYAPGEPAGFLAAVLGAMVLLLIYRLLFRRRTAP